MHALDGREMAKSSDNSKSRGRERNREGEGGGVVKAVKKNCNKFHLARSMHHKTSL